jgi:glycosyltransferase involved in cell wall biosynthesis
MEADSLELLVVTPVYNEESSIETVLDEWCKCLDACGLRYAILALDDGSTDQTGEVLQGLRKKWGARIEVVPKKNSGHGRTILQGYLRALDRGVPWIFQIDSDGQCDPRYFPELWAQRDSHDLVAGYRASRDDGASRVLVSLVLRLFVLLLFQTYCRDANVPYRLLRASAVAPLLRKIPADCFFTNVALSILARRAGLRQKFIPIGFRDRHAGTSTVSYLQLAGHAVRLFRNLRELPR